MVPLGTAASVCPPVRACAVVATIRDYQIMAGRNGTLRYVVRVAYANQPAQPDTTVIAPRAEVRDALGARLAPIREITPVRVPPGGQAEVEYRFEQVFPLVEPRLHLSTGRGWERALGAVVLDAQESLLHAPRLFALQ